MSQRDPATMRHKCYVGVETHRAEEQSNVSQRDPATMRLKWHAGEETHRGEEQATSHKETQQQ